MTREEAIMLIEKHKYPCAESSADAWFTKSNEAIDMAIEALRREEAEEKGYCHRIIPKPCEVYEDYEHATLVDIKEPLVKHDREWIIGCIKHDGFIKTDRFDEANQIILDALSGEAETKCVAQIKVDTEEIVSRIKEEYDITDGWIPCSERLPNVGENVLFTTDIYGGYVAEGDRRADGKWWQYRWNSLLQNDEVIAWMPLPKPWKGADDE